MYTRQQQYNINRFIEHVQDYCSLFNIDVQFRHGLTCRTPENEVADGFFVEPENGDPGILAVATGGPTDYWITTLGHEFGHVQQWATDAPCYEDTWDSEVDAEKRSHKLMRKFKIPIDREWHKRETDSFLRYIRVNNLV